MSTTTDDNNNPCQVKPIKLNLLQRKIIYIYEHIND